MAEKQTRTELIDGVAYEIWQGMCYHPSAIYFSVTTYPENKRTTKIFGKRNYPDFNLRYAAAVEFAKTRIANPRSARRLHKKMAPTKKSGLPVGITLMRVKRKNGKTYDSFLVQVGNNKRAPDATEPTGMRKCIGIGVKDAYSQGRYDIMLERAKAERARMAKLYEAKYPQG